MTDPWAERVPAPRDRVHARAVVATLASEIFEDLPGADTLVVPVGGGNLIAGAALVAKLLDPGVHIVGVQSEAAPAVCLSWKQRRPVEAPCTTLAGGPRDFPPGRVSRATQGRRRDIRAPMRRRNGRKDD